MANKAASDETGARPQDVPPDPVYSARLEPSHGSSARTWLLARGSSIRFGGLKASWGRNHSGNNSIKNPVGWWRGPEAEGSRAENQPLKNSPLSALIFWHIQVLRSDARILLSFAFQ